MALSSAALDIEVSLYLQVCLSFPRRVSFQIVWAECKVLQVSVPSLHYETLAIAILAIYIDFIGRTVLQWLGEKRSHWCHHNYNDRQL